MTVDFANANVGHQMSVGDRRIARYRAVEGAPERPSAEGDTSGCRFGLDESSGEEVAVDPWPHLTEPAQAWSESGDAFRAV